MAMVFYDEASTMTREQWEYLRKRDLEHRCTIRQHKASLCHTLARGAMNLNFLETARIDQADSRLHHNEAWKLLAELIGVAE